MADIDKRGEQSTKFSVIKESEAEDCVTAHGTQTGNDLTKALWAALEKIDKLTNKVTELERHIVMQNNRMSKLEDITNEDSGTESEKIILHHKNNGSPCLIKQPNIETSMIISKKEGQISSLVRRNSNSDDDSSEGEAGATFLEDHVTSTTSEKTHKCSYCDKAFIKPYSLKCHMRIHTGEKPYQCSHCEKAFTMAGSLKKHVKIHTGEKPYQCEHCDKSFSHDCQLKAHLKIHNGEEPYKCNQCGKAFFHNTDFITHLMLHTGEKPYQCIICEKDFSNNSYLRDHLSTHVRTHTTEKPYNCSHCAKTFSHNLNLIKHLRIHTHLCSQCGKICTTKRNLLYHQLTHAEEKQYQCDHCNKAFAHNDLLKSHIKIRHGEKAFQHTSINPNQLIPQESGTAISPTISDFLENPTSSSKNEVEEKIEEGLLGEESGATFLGDDHVASTSSGSSIESCEVQMSCKHKIQVNTGETTKNIPTEEKPHQCSHCDKAFTKNSSLKNHLRIHTVEHKCNQCDKVFIKKCYLKYHLRIHTGEKPYQCSHCDKAFALKSTLTLHQQRAHTGEKSHQCNQCGKFFTCKGGLVRHQLTHTGEKPYQCSQCDLSFKQSFSLKRHLLTAGACSGGGKRAQPQGSAIL